MIKFAAATVLSAELGAQRATLRTAHRADFSHIPRRPGYLYVRCRAISSRCNDNHDEFPAEEIKKAYKTFIGKPVFVNHSNSNHKRARGVIVDAALHEDRNPDGSPDTWVELLQEVDAVRFPMLAKAILAGEVDRTSMGTDVGYSKCSYCGNKASDPSRYCSHIPRLKGKRIRRVQASGQSEDVLVREICYGLSFFENSLLVEDPADPTALVVGVESGDTPVIATRKVAVKTAINEIKAPPAIDTLRQDCPICGSDIYDGKNCQICGFVSPPDQFLDPDLDKAKEIDLRQDKASKLVCDECGAQFPTADTPLVSDPKPFVPPGTEEAPVDPKEPVSKDNGPDGTLPKGPPKAPETHAEGDECPVCHRGTLKTQEGEGDDSGVSEKPAIPGNQTPDTQAPAFIPPSDSQNTDKGKKTSVQRKERSTMRPALAALAEQQRQIELQKRQIAILRDGLSYIATLAGVPMTHPRLAGLRRRADVDNPAEPVPEPAAEAPSETTDEALAPDGRDDVTSIGATSETDVAADATTDLFDTGVALDEPLDLNEQDPTQPVAGTQEPRPLSETKIETDVRIDQSRANDPTQAFPLEGPFAEKATTGNRTYASLHLARLQIQAGLARGDDLTIGSQIDQDPQMTDQRIADQTATLEAVIKSQGGRTRQAPRNLVPRVASSNGEGGGRSLPSMQSQPSLQVVGSVGADELLFE